MKMKKQIKFIITAIILLSVITLTLIIAFPFIKNMHTTEGQLSFKDEIQGLGFKGVALLFLLQVLQVSLVILPGEPIEVLAGMCYGSIWGTVFIMLSFFIITSIIVLLVKKYGGKCLYFFFSEDKIHKYERKLSNKNSKLEIILFLLFFIPGMPKDIIVYVGGLLPIKPLRFILIATFARFPSIITSTMVGSNLLKGNLKLSAIIYGVTFIVTAIILLVVHKRDKNKELQEILDIDKKKI